MNKDLVSYYQDRASEYDKVYLNPEEQTDLLIATTLFQSLFAKRIVLEIACGTGYWTERIGKTATSVQAIDINEAVIEIAKGRMSNSNTTFEVADMYSFNSSQKFEGLFGGFIWSHILLQDLDIFLEKVKGFLKPEGVMVFIDSKNIEGTNHDIKKITKTDEYGNTYQTRKLENGSTHLVLKNFPTNHALFEKISKVAIEISFVETKFYWIVTCKVK